MGSPKKTRKKYETPEHPWRKERIESEKLFKEEYGLKNKKEVYKVSSSLRSYYRQARSLISGTSMQAKKEEKLLLEKLYNYNLLQDRNVKVEVVLNLNMKDLLERRLQTLVYRQGLAKSIKQARQFIVHGHVFVKGKKITVPNYMVKRDEEGHINYDPVSSLFKEDHPERVKIMEEIKRKNPMTPIKEDKKESKEETHAHKEHKEEHKEKKTTERKPKKEKKAKEE